MKVDTTADSNELSTFCFDTKQFLRCSNIFRECFRPVENAANNFKLSYKKSNWLDSQGYTAREIVNDSIYAAQLEFSDDISIQMD